MSGGEREVDRAASGAALSARESEASGGEETEAEGMGEGKNESLFEIANEVGLLSRMEEMLTYQNSPICSVLIFERPVAQYFKDLAFRIEAARNREREELKSRYQAIIDSRGNAAELREALKLMQYWLLRFFESGNDDSDKRMIVAKLREYLSKSKSALAAPSRNCDRFATRKEAWEAYAEKRELLGEPSDFEAWLFAPAEI